MLIVNSYSIIVANSGGQNTKLKTRWHKSKSGEHIRTWMSQMETNRKLANVRRHMHKYHAEHARTDFGKRHHNRMFKRKQCRTQHIQKNTGPRKVPWANTKKHVIKSGKTIICLGFSKMHRKLHIYRTTWHGIKRP